MAVETVLNHGRRYGSDKQIGIDFGNDFVDFEALYDAVKKQLAAWSEMAIAEINEIEEDYPQINQSPIISGTYENCMRTGVDAYSGGAKYNNSSICAFGIGTITDALVAIKKAVFEDKLITLDKLTEILKNNWNGEDTLRKTMQEKYPKYGNNDNEADDIALDLKNHMSDCINNKSNGRGGVFRLGFFSIDWIIDYGKKLGATADGRLAGEPVSKNIRASVGMDKKGVTGIINSAAKFDYSLISDGTVLDLSIHPTVVENKEGLDIMTSLIKLYFKKGGFAVHMNVLSPETLRKAQQNPEKYSNLQVRVCGWNEYFVKMTKEKQDDFIRRCRSAQ
jgi:formate C-acetyltransferase